MKYSHEHKKFFEEFVPGHSHKEVQRAFKDKFGIELKLSQVKAYIGNHKLKTGRTGRFEKGNIPFNKGKKGIYYRGSEKTWFKKGQAPINYSKVGTERVDSEGYIYIKIADPDVWKLKHRYIWEMAYGPVPSDSVLIFKDNNSLNCDLDNLILIPKPVNMILNKFGLCRNTGDAKEIAIKIAELKIATNKARKEINCENIL